MTEREAQALLKVDEYSRWAFGLGLIPLPLVDFLSVTGVQLRMVGQIAQVYGYSVPRGKAKSILVSLLGGYIPHTLSWGTIGSLVKGVPVIGPLVGMSSMAVLSAASTYAVGKVFIQHFESGGTFLDFSADGAREYMARQYAEAKQAFSGTRAPEKKSGATAPAAT